MENLLPENSKEKYLLAYQNFIQWHNSKNTQSFSEDVFMEYFKELSSKYKPSSLWCIYSMLRSTVRSENEVDLKTYSNLSAYLKKLSDGFSSKKSKVLSSDDIEKFIKDAPDNQYLATKVALIFGVTGACGIQELTNITEKNIENQGQTLLVKIITKNKTPRSFVIQGPFYEIVKKYESLRSPKGKTDRFFLNYQNGKCTCQPIGINKFGSMPKEVAKFLGLADAESYTGHSFRRTSATFLSNSEADLLILKRHSGSRSSNEEELYVKDSIQNKKKTTLPTDGPFSTPNDSISSTNTNNVPSQMSIKQENISISNQSDETAMSSKATKRIKLESGPLSADETPSTSSDCILPTHRNNMSFQITIKQENISDETAMPSNITKKNKLEPEPLSTDKTSSSPNDRILPTNTNNELPQITIKQENISISNQSDETDISSKATKRIKLESGPLSADETPSTSSDCILPTYRNDMSFQITIKQENISEETALPSNITKKNKLEPEPLSTDKTSTTPNDRILPTNSNNELPQITIKQENISINNLSDETAMSSNITKRIKLESEVLETSTTSNDRILPTDTNNVPSQITIKQENISINNQSDETDISSKIVKYNFTNCTLNNCISK